MLNVRILVIVMVNNKNTNIILYVLTYVLLYHRPYQTQSTYAYSYAMYVCEDMLMSMMQIHCMHMYVCIIRMYICVYAHSYFDYLINYSPYDYCNVILRRYVQIHTYILSLVLA